MWVVLLFSAVCLTIVAVRLFFALKPARSTMGAHDPSRQAATAAAPSAAARR